MHAYNSEGSCPAYGDDSDVMGDHGMVCGTGGDRIARHNALRDAFHDTATAARLAPRKEMRALLPSNNRRPADIYIPGWSGGRDAALDVCVTSPLQDRYRAQAAREPGYALTQAYPARNSLYSYGCQVPGRLAQGGSRATQEAGICAS